MTLFNVLYTFSNSDITVNKCNLIIRYAKGKADFKKFNITVQGLVEDWIKLKQDGRIKKLNIILKVQSVTIFMSFEIFSNFLLFYLLILHYLQEIITYKNLKTNILL